MSERRVVEAADDFIESSYNPGYYYGRIVGTINGTDLSTIYIKGHMPGKGEIMVVEPDDDPPVRIRYPWIFKIVE